MMEIAHQLQRNTWSLLRRGFPFLAIAWIAAPPARAGAPPFGAHDGLDLARAAATSWSPDAALVYLENDEPLTDGLSPRWSYLFFSPTRDQARGWSVKNGRIVESANLDFRFESLPIGGGWVDGVAALRAAEEAEAFRKLAGAEVRHLLLVRNGLADEQPETATWLVVCSAPDAPDLFVVVDAGTARVLKSWRG